MDITLIGFDPIRNRFRYPIQWELEQSWQWNVNRLKFVFFFLLLRSIPCLRLPGYPNMVVHIHFYCSHSNFMR